MRALLAIFCGTVGGTMISAAGIVTCLFAFMGHAGDLARAAFTLAAWSTGFGIAFLIVALIGVTANVTESLNPPSKEAPDV